MTFADYHFSGEEDVPSPALVYYAGIIEENTRKAVRAAGDAGRLWPHVKTHKMAALVEMQIRAGITRFKCATIAEAELCARSGAADILLAYPLVGPNIRRFLELRRLYRASRFWALGDDPLQIRFLGEAALADGKAGGNVPLLVDVNLGMDRTGVSPSDLGAFCTAAAGTPGISPRGFHCYDGHTHTADAAARQAEVEENFARFCRAFAGLPGDIRQGAPQGESPVIIAGGTPTFPCYARIARSGGAPQGAELYFSPGTLFVQDWGYAEAFPDLDYSPGAALLCRVVSRPAPDLFTIDLGAKALTADPSGKRGIITEMPDAVPLSQSEEHWVFRRAGYRQPEIGTVLYVLPAHVCPTTALYPGAIVVKGGLPVSYWEVGARDRSIGI